MYIQLIIWFIVYTRLLGPYNLSVSPSPLDLGSGIGVLGIRDNSCKIHWTNMIQTIHRTIIYQLSFPVLSLGPGPQLLLVFVLVTLNVAALPLSTVLGQLCDVKCHSPSSELWSSDPHIHHV